MKLEVTTLGQLRGGDLFFYPGSSLFAGVQVQTDEDVSEPGDNPGDTARVVRIVCECEAVSLGENP